MNKNKLIVALGASAGGLEALESFFKAMSSDSNMAFIVVVHLDPTHISLLPELLQRNTKMEVVKITDGVAVEANKIYVIPPNYQLSILNGELQLIKPVKLRAKLPIDYFFRELAQDQGSNAVCIVLSGTGSDGSSGLKDIKAEAGMVMVQSIESAKYDGMPQNAISTGMADYILTPTEMPKRLKSYYNHLQGIVINDDTDVKTIKSTLHKILGLIRNKTGHDFSLYKKNTIFRRIERRMHVRQVKSIEDYLEFIQKNDSEITILFRELLIGVTSFFRDKEAFESLRNEILPKLLENKPDNYTVRVWVTGCSSGEEAYSIAITIQECLLSIKKNMTVQVFATDIDEISIEQARSGLYPLNIIDDVSEDYCHRYFTRIDDQFLIKKSIRETLVFATQNLIKDPPFTKLDLVCCRNLLIYFDTELQKKILPVFHYSLKEDGLLFLGPSETTGQSNHYFEILDKKWKIFKRTPQSEYTRLATSGLHFSDSISPITFENPQPGSNISKIEEMSALQLVETILRQSDVAPCVVIDERQNVIYVHGRLGQYLEPAEGQGNNQILEMVRSPQLKSELTHCIRKVSIHKKRVDRKALSLQVNENKVLLDLTITPLADIGSLKGMIMLTFVETKVAIADSEDETTTVLTKKDNDVNFLRRELESTRENLQTTIEELETSNEELKSSNEELQSTNEELQSTNEELETSKEELQSLNEESTTVNAELQSRIEELSQTNDDIKNLLDSTQIATLFLDTELKIRRFTPKMTEIINLVITDINRSISDLSTSLLDVKLTEYAANVLKTLEKVETEVCSENDCYYKMRILPYRTINNVIDGVVISFEDISKFKQVEIFLRESEQRYKGLFEHCPVAILEVDVINLVNYLQEKKLTTLSQYEKYLSTQPSDAAMLMAGIKGLNANKLALTLFNSRSKEIVLNSLPALFNIEDFIDHQLRAIAKNLESSQFNSQVYSLKDEKQAVEITITTSKVNKKLNHKNTILAIAPVSSAVLKSTR